MPRSVGASTDKMGIVTTEKGQACWSFNSLFVPHQQAEQAEESLRRFVKYGIGDPATGRAAKLLLLTGPSRSGKTAILTRLQRQFPSTTSEGADCRPIIMHTLLEKTSIKELATGLLIKLGDGAPDKGTRARKLDRVGHHLREQGVKAIILDEGHHLIDSDSSKVIYSVSESIKNLLNLGLCPIVLSGMPQTEIVVEENPQLQGRLFSRCRLTGLDWRNPDERKTFRLILHRFDQETPLPRRANLGDTDLAVRIWLCTDGLVGLVAQLLETAIIDAIEEGATSLDRSRLAAAFEKLRLVEPDSNPFRKMTIKADEPLVPLQKSSYLARKTKLRAGKRSVEEMPI